MSTVPLDSSPLVQRLRSPPSAAVSSTSAADPGGLGPDVAVERRTVGRTASSSSTQVETTPSRSGTLKKAPSTRKRASLSRRSSRRSLRAGGLRGTGNEEDDDYNNIFNTPIPTHGNPTELLANRFQAWRKLLKDLITYFREIQSSYEARSKALVKVSNVINTTYAPNGFLSQAGLGEALITLRGFHKISVTEANKSKDIEDDVITQLNGLRSDLTQKIKEIKSLSGDFKNSVDKEKDSTRKAVEHLKDVLAAAEADPASASGKNDPFIVRLAVERQVERQIEEENYLHRAYLNLEGSGRELESIVIGEIQKAYNAYAGILRRESDHAQQTIEDLRSGPIAMPKDQEWNHFVASDDHFVDPNVPVRRLEDIYFAGKYDVAASEIRGGMLERKSKYLKSYTPGWYVLSPTHLHEFKSADHIHTQQPVMSLYLLDQRLGSRSQPGASSDKFSLKGKQAGGIHRGHAWVFRAESYDTMMAWFEDIRILTEKSGPERTAFVRKHARSVSGGTHPAAPSISSDGLDEDEADEEPYSANDVVQQSALTPPPKRPEPGGRFPSDINVNRTLNPPSSGSSHERDDTVTSGSPNGFNILGCTPKPAALPVVGSSASESSVSMDQRPKQGPIAAGPVQPVVQSNQQIVAPSEAYNGQRQSVPQTYELPGVKSSPAQSSALPSNGLGDGTNDSSPGLAAAGGAAGGAAAATMITGPYGNGDQAGASIGEQLQEANHEPNHVTSPILPVTSLQHPNDAPQPRISYFDPPASSSPQLTPSVPSPREPTLPNIKNAAFAFPAPQPETQAYSLTPTGQPITDASSIVTDSTVEPPTPTATAELHGKGQVFPGMSRHETSASVSDLYIPGGFPPPTPVELE